MQDDAGADGLPCLGGTAAPGRQRNAETRTGADGGHDIDLRLGENDAERHNLINARIGRIKSAAQTIEAHFSGHAGGQGVLQPGNIDDSRPSGRTFRYERQGSDAHSDPFRARWSANRSNPCRSCSSPRSSVSPPAANETRSVPSPAGPYAEP